MRGQRWRIGELAAAAGLSVRTLRYYEGLGLLAPPDRSEAGHRRYGTADVQRLYQIRALRQLGLTLREVAAVLTRGDISLEALLCRHLEEVSRQIALQRALQARLRHALLLLQESAEISTEDLMDAMNRMTLLQRYLTPEQLDQIRSHRAALGTEELAAVWQERSRLSGQLEAARQAGEDPRSPRVQALRQQFVDLHQRLIGFDPGVLHALHTMVDAEGVKIASGGTMTPELRAYLAAGADSA